METNFRCRRHLLSRTVVSSVETFIVASCGFFFENISSSTTARDPFATVRRVRFQLCQRFDTQIIQMTMLPGIITSEKLKSGDEDHVIHDFSDLYFFILHLELFAIRFYISLSAPWISSGRCQSFSICFPWSYDTSRRSEFLDEYIRKIQ